MYSMFQWYVKRNRTHKTVVVRKLLHSLLDMHWEDYARDMAREKQEQEEKQA